MKSAIGVVFTAFTCVAFAALAGLTEEAGLFGAIIGVGVFVSRNKRGDTK